MNPFESLGLSGKLVDVISQLGFETPTPIQEKTIPILLGEKTDLVGLAQTGTGKTAAFGLPLIELIDASKNNTQALVLAPTRELSQQITNDFDRFTKAYKHLNIVTVYGGASISEQIRKVRKGAQIIVATPGRLIDLLSRKVVDLSRINYVVLDEADEMLNMGFKEDIDEILSSTPDTKNVWLFSATMPKEVREISKNYMNSPREVTMGERNQGNENIEHQYVIVHDRDKYLALKRLVDYNPGIFGVIFCRTKVDTQNIAEHLIKDGYNADSLHGDLSQQQRDRVMRSFKNKALQLLVATDVAARGIDVSNISHVVHMNLPDEMEFYTHRSGRTARAGKKGISLAIISRREVGRIGQIEKGLKRRFTKITVPTGSEVCQKKLLDLMHRVREVEVNDEEMDSFLPEVFHELMGLEKEEIIKRFASIEFNRFLAYYRDAPDLNQPDKATEFENRAEAYRTGDRIFINVGKMDGLDKGSLIGLICDFGEITKSQIGKIDLKGAYSFFELDKKVTDKVVAGFDGVEVRGRAVRLEISGPKKSDDRKPGRNRNDKFKGRSKGRSHRR